MQKALHTVECRAFSFGANLVLLPLPGHRASNLEIGRQRACPYLLAAQSFEVVTLPAAWGLREAGMKQEVVHIMELLGEATPRVD